MVEKGWERVRNLVALLILSVKVAKFLCQFRIMINLPHNIHNDFQDRL